MAVAEIIGAAIGVMLLLVVAYMLVGSVLTTAEVVTTAQKDITLLNEARLMTSISLNRSEIFSNITPYVLNFSVTNTGNEIISDFDHTDVYTWNGSSAGYQNYIYDTYNTGTTGNWSKMVENDLIHPEQLDPGEKMWVTVNYPIGDEPIWFQITTGNGVYAQTTYT